MRKEFILNSLQTPPTVLVCPSNLFMRQNAPTPPRQIAAVRQIATPLPCPPRHSFLCHAAKFHAKRLARPAAIRYYRPAHTAPRRGLHPRTGGRVVECSGLENRRRSCLPWVRIPPCPLEKTPARPCRAGVFSPHCRKKTAARHKFCLHTHHSRV